ncbi:MAG: phosphoribosylglycinamide formyltransferase, partial [Bacteroidales bacterium]|nr:phosphoribosylglycinamide formyltransferase [Bacteroidales bacterium]
FMRPLLRQYGITHIVLAGFLALIPAYLTTDFPGRILNIHPALLPKFGGKGMYGEHVHKAVVSAGESKSGITVHLVNEEYDRGRILFQAECEISPEDTPATVAEMIHALEQTHFPPVIERWVEGGFSFQ